MFYTRNILIAAILILILLGVSTPLLAAPVSQAAPIAATLAQQPQPTVAPTAAPNATQTSGRRRIEAPPLRPQAAALLIGANIAVAIAIVLFAMVLRRRKQRKESGGS